MRISDRYSGFTRAKPTRAVNGVNSVNRLRNKPFTAFSAINQAVGEVVNGVNG